jgi:YegS/Rv2252/BmrU family lipid kinase
MKHIFLVNPAAGDGKANTVLLPSIIETAKKLDVDYEIHRTVNVGDAHRFVVYMGEQHPGEFIRYYSCGGDGTMNEVLNGIMSGDPEKSELAVIPTGTGNDFVRNFGGAKPFLDVEAQMTASAVKVDAIRYKVEVPEVSVDIGPALDAGSNDRDASQLWPLSEGYALNMFNSGFDANVVERTGRIKKRPLMSGTLAYIGGVLGELATLKGVDMTLTVDGEEIYSGPVLLTGVANGRFSGGGFDGMPQARTNDGYMDILLAHTMTRRFFLSIIKKYHDGTHFEDPRIDGVIWHYRCKTAELKPEIPVTLAIDGEVCTISSGSFEICPEVVNLVLPNGVDL